MKAISAAGIKAGVEEVRLRYRFFGILKRNGRVYTQIIKNASRAQIRPIINRLVHKKSTLYTDKWWAYYGLAFNGYKHYRINHSKEEYSDCKGTHINGIEAFWSYAKRRLIRAKRHTSKRFLFTLERM